MKIPPKPDNMTLDYVFYILLRSLMIITLVTSFFFCFRNFNPAYLRLFPFYHLTACTTELIVDLYFSNHLRFSTSTNIPYNLFAFLEFIFFSYFISNQLDRKKYKLIIFISAGITAMILFNFTIKYHSLDYSNLIFTIPLNAFYIISSFLYFINTFSNLTSSNISKDPSFWIVSGILFNSVVVMPTLIISLEATAFARSLYIIINSIGYLFLHLLFIKAYTCRIQK